MKSKTCTKCNKISYSSNDKGIWICPYCGTDISKIETGEPTKLRWYNGKR